MGKRKLSAPAKLKVKKIKQTSSSQIIEPADTTPEEFWKSMEQGVSSSFLKVKLQTLNRIIIAIKQGDVLLLEYLFHALIVASFSPSSKIPPLIVQCLKQAFKAVEPFHFDKHPRAIKLFSDLIYTILQTKYLVYFQASYEIFDQITSQNKFETFAVKIFTETFVKDITNKYKIALKNTEVIFKGQEGKESVLELYKIASLNRFAIFLLNKTIELGLPIDPIIELLANYLNGLYNFILKSILQRVRSIENLTLKFVETTTAILIENNIHNKDYGLICKCIKNKIEELNE